MSALRGYTGTRIRVTCCVTADPQRCSGTVTVRSCGTNPSCLTLRMYCPGRSAHVMGNPIPINPCTESTGDGGDPARRTMTAQVVSEMSVPSGARTLNSMPRMPGSAHTALLFWQLVQARTSINTAASRLHVLCMIASRREYTGESAQAGTSTSQQLRPIRERYVADTQQLSYAAQQNDVVGEESVPCFRSGVCILASTRSACDRSARVAHTERVGRLRWRK